MDNINENLAKAMGYYTDKLQFGIASKTGSPNDYHSFDYKNDDIFRENIKWLLDNGWELMIDSVAAPELYLISTYSKVDGQVYDVVADKDIFKAAALARIQAEE